MKNFDLFRRIKPSINNADTKDSKKSNKKIGNPKKINFLNQEIQYQIYKNETFIKNHLNNIFEKIVKNSLISESYIIFSLINELTLIIGRSFLLNQKMNGPLTCVPNQFKLVRYGPLNKKKIKYLFFSLLNKNKRLKIGLGSKYLSYTKIKLQNTEASQFTLLFKNFYKNKNIKKKLNLMADGTILFDPSKRKLLNFVSNEQPKIKKTRLINFCTKDLKLDCVVDDQKKAFFNKKHSKLLKQNKLQNVNLKKKNWAVPLIKNQTRLKSDLLFKNLFYKQWFLNFLEALKKSIFSFKNFIFFSRSKSISFSIKKLFLFLYLEPKFILNLEVVLKKTNLNFLLNSYIADKADECSNPKTNFSLCCQNKINPLKLVKIFKITASPDQTSLNNKANYVKIFKLNLCVENQITSSLLKNQLLKQYSLLPLVDCFTRCFDNKKQKKNNYKIINKKKFNLIQYKDKEIIKTFKKLTSGRKLNTKKLYLSLNLKPFFIKIKNGPPEMRSDLCSNPNTFFIYLKIGFKKLVGCHAHPEFLKTNNFLIFNTAFFNLFLGDLRVEKTSNCVASLFCYKNEIYLGDLMRFTNLINYWIAIANEVNFNFGALRFSVSAVVNKIKLNHFKKNKMFKKINLKRFNFNFFFTLINFLQKKWHRRAAANLWQNKQSVQQIYQNIYREFFYIFFIFATFKQSLKKNISLKQNSLIARQIFAMQQSYYFNIESIPKRTNFFFLINNKPYFDIENYKYQTCSNNRLKKTLITKKKFYKKILDIVYKFGDCTEFLKKIMCVETNEFLLNSLITLSEKIFFNYLLSKVIFNIKNIINKRLQLINSALNINLNKFNLKKNVLFKKYRFFNLKFNKITYRILKKKYYIFLYKIIKIYFMSNNFLFYLKKQYLTWFLGLLYKPLRRSYSFKKWFGWEAARLCSKTVKLNVLKKTFNLTVNSFFTKRKNTAIYLGDFLEKKLIFIFLVTAALFVLVRKSPKNKKTQVNLLTFFNGLAIKKSCRRYSILKTKKTNFFFNLNFLKNKNNVLKNHVKLELFTYFLLKNYIILYNFIEHSTICKISNIKISKINLQLLGSLRNNPTKQIIENQSNNNKYIIYKFKNYLPSDIQFSRRDLLGECINKQNTLKQRKILIKILNYKKTNFFFLKIKNNIIFYKQIFFFKNKTHTALQKHINKLKRNHNKMDLFSKQKYSLQFLINRVDLENFFLNFYQLILKIQVKFSQNFFFKFSIFYGYKLLVFDSKGNILNKHKNTFINILYKKNLTMKRKILLHTISSLNSKKKEFIFYGFHIFQKMFYQKVHNFKKNFFIKESQSMLYCYKFEKIKIKNQQSEAVFFCKHKQAKSNKFVAQTYQNFKIQLNAPKIKMTNCYKISNHVIMISGANILKDNKNNINLDFLTLIIPSKRKLNEHKNQLKSIMLKSLGKKQDLLIKKLAPIIRKWCNYFKDKNIKNIGPVYKVRSYFINNKYNLIFKKNSLITHRKIYEATQVKKINLACDFYLIKNLWGWSLKRHKNKNNAWIKNKYFYSINNHQFLFTKKRQIYVLETLNKKSIKKRLPADVVFFSNKLTKNNQNKPFVQQIASYQRNNCKTFSASSEKVLIKKVFVDTTNHY